MRALGRILELQATDPTASTTRQACARRGRSCTSLTRSSALELPYVAAAARIADLGSGAGWPGLALAAALPDAHVSLVDSAIRHCRYLEKAVEIGELTNVTVVNARAEAWPEGAGVHDLVTARALAALPVILEYAAPLLAEGGHVVAWKARRFRRRSARTVWLPPAILGLEPLPVVESHPVPGCPRPLAAPVSQDRAHAGPLPAAPGHGGQASARPDTRLKLPLNAGSVFHVKQSRAGSDRSRR